VVPGFTVPPGLPPVVDLPLGTERLRLVSRRPRVEQVLLLGEQLVAGPHDGAAEAPRRQIDRPRPLRTVLGHARSLRAARRHDPASRTRNSPKGSPATSLPRNHVERTTPASGRSW